MKKVDTWAVNETKALFDVNVTEAYKVGFYSARRKIFDIIKEYDRINTETLKEDPGLTSYLLLELADKINTLGDE